MVVQNERKENSLKSKFSAEQTRHGSEQRLTAIGNVRSLSGRSLSGAATYFVAFFIDTSLGVGLAVGLHQLVVVVARIAASESGTKTGLAAALARPGSYGDPVNKSVFCVQLFEFTIAVIIARAACGSLIILFRHQLIHVAAELDRAFRGYPNILLLFVMEEPARGIRQALSEITGVL
eukprot:jgi/Astpho2/2373/Aster-x1070